MSAAFELSQEAGKKAACEALTVPRATFYRHLSPKPPQEEKPRPAPALALTKQERKTVNDILHSKRFQATKNIPAQVPP